MAKKKQKQSKHDQLDDLLVAFGLDVITHDQFWSKMKSYGYNQDDIDRWCEEYHNDAWHSKNQTAD